MTELTRFEQQVLSFIRRYQLIEGNSHVAIGVSGGPDSVALLNILVSLRSSLGISQISVLHFDHRLRGDDSRGDRDFVGELAEKLNLPFHSHSGDVLAYHQQHRVSIEMAARTLRHHFFKHTLQQLDVREIALGHIADDQAEEILLRMFRGTGPSGMTGMLPRTGTGIIRPLLFARRWQVLAYLNEVGIPFREDISNTQAFCQRNSLRLEIIPKIEEMFQHSVSATIVRHSQLAREESDYWNCHLSSIWGELCKEENTVRILLRCYEISKLHTALQRRFYRFALEKLLGHLSGIFTVHIETLKAFASRQNSGKWMKLPGPAWAYKESENLVLSKYAPVWTSATEESVTCIMKQPGTYRFPTFQLSVRSAETYPPASRENLSCSRDIVWMDADTVHWPLLLRHWEPGDRFQPLGMSAQKKLQDFFTDARVPRSKRHAIPILADQEKICWVLGYRLDARVRLTEKTKRVLIAEKQSL